MNALLIYKCVTFIACSIALTQANTEFINKSAKIESFSEPQWFIDQIPFIDVPDKLIEKVYYYRWSVLKRHIRYTQLGAGYMFTEFILPVSHSNKFETLNDASGHHINEAKWLRNRRYVQDYINLMTRSSNGMHHYSDWFAESVWNAYGIIGDTDFVKSTQQPLVNIYNGWSDHFESSLGLYYISPVNDAQEYSCASYETSDPHRGGVGYRPSFNSEMYGNAVAIAKIALLNNDTETYEQFRKKASDLRESILTHLWDADRNFFYHMQRLNNTNNSLIESKEQIGFFPFRFNVPDNQSYAIIWEQLLDTRGFSSEFGPTTCERRSKYYHGDYKCTCWNGNSWPYSTSLTLGALSNTINYYEQNIVSKSDYFELLSRYANTSYKNGEPYVAECHSPETDMWFCDKRNHSEHYFHSTFNDNILSELFGIKPRTDDVFEMNPIIPDSWDYFAIENLVYHSHNITILWDKTGNHYNLSKGLFVYVDGKQFANSTEIKHLVIDIPVPNLTRVSVRENYATNVNRNGYPKASASYTHDNNNSYAWNAMDGRIFYDHMPINVWTNKMSPNSEDWFAIDFGSGRAKVVDEVIIYFYANDTTEGGNIGCPLSYRIEYLTAEHNWTSVQNAAYNPVNCSPNNRNVINFTPIRTQQIRAVFDNNAVKNHFVAITEFEIWANYPQTSSSTDNVYEAEDGIIVNGLINESESASSGSYVRTLTTNNTSIEIGGISVAKPSVYNINIYYCNADNGIAKQNLVINNLYSIEIEYPRNCESWSVFDNQSYVQVSALLLSGRNFFEFRQKQFSVEIDKVLIV